MTRKFNFCAGPAALPESVLERARNELADWHGKGLSVMEMSHRSKEFVAIAAEAEKDFLPVLDGLGLTYEALNDLQNAKLNYGEALKLNPNDFTASTGLKRVEALLNK